MASDIFAKIGDIKGESADSKHKGEIDILSFSWGVANSGSLGTGGGGGAGKATFHDLSFTHSVDKASPLLLKACATGEHIKEATIAQRKGSSKGPHEFLIIKMNDVLITSVSMSSSESGGASESISMAFAKVDLECRAQKADGTFEAGVHFKYDIKGNKEG